MEKPRLKAVLPASTPTKSRINIRLNISWRKLKHKPKNLGSGQRYAIQHHNDEFSRYFKGLAGLGV